MRQQRPQRRRTRLILALVLTVAGVLAPVDSAALPEPLERFAGADPVLAQINPTRVEAGIPDPCPPPRTVAGTQGQDCVLETTACGENPLRSDPLVTDDYLTPSATYPNFCEYAILRSTDRPLFFRCLAQTGFVVRNERLVGVLPGGRNDRRCTLFQPVTCTANSLGRDGTDQQVGPHSCRSIKRRAWTCQPGAIPRNDFNTCYRPAAASNPGSVCGPGAPDLVALSCEDYAANDFAQSPLCTDASAFDTGGTTTALGASSGGNPHWCEFDAAFLRIDCHRTNPPAPAGDCTPDTRTCLKRASRTGGCDAIAETIRCRRHQAAFADQDPNATAAAVRGAGCEPCVVLPFRSIPAGCPDDLRPGSQRQRTSRPLPQVLATQYARKTLNLSVRGCTVAGQSFDNLTITSQCTDPSLAGLACPSPPPGRLHWRSTHSSGVAIVNSLIILSIDEIPLEFEERVSVLLWPSLGLILNRQAIAHYADPDPNRTGPIMNLMSELDPQQQVDDWGKIGYRPHDGTRIDCRVFASDEPAFDVAIEELWPDSATKRQEIVDLFGAESLRWWDNLSSQEKEARTTARGLVYLDDPTLTQAERMQETDRRAQVSPSSPGSLVQRVDCVLATPTWCSWSPTRPGYYRLAAAAVWRVRYSERNQWRLDLSTLEAYFARLSPGQRSHMLARLTNHGLTPADIGVTDTLDALLPLPAGDPNEVPYTLPDEVLCPTRDVRLSCGNSGTTYTFGETTPIGIQVHELRVVTRTPNLAASTP